MQRGHWVVGLALLVLTACSSGTGTVPTAMVPTEPPLSLPTAPPATLAGTIQTAPGYTLVPVATGLDLPTQMVRGPDDRLWLVQLAGRENEGTGQVVSLALETGERRVEVASLRQTPTGIAILEDTVWVALVTELHRYAVEGGQVAGDGAIILDELPNTRSGGTLSVTPDGKLLYMQEGTAPGEDASRSGGLWHLDPRQPDNPEVIASGFAIPYAHTYDSEGNLWVVNVTDEVRDNTVVPDTLSVIPVATLTQQRGAICYRDALPPTPVPDACATTVQPVMAFIPHTTPTSIVMAPWNPQALLITLWVAGEVIEVKYQMQDNEVVITEQTVLIEGLQNPQHLLVWDEGVLVSEFATGTIYRLSPAVP